MMSACLDYLSTLAERFGQGWNQFWYQPRSAETLGRLRIGVGLVALYLIGTWALDLVEFFGPQGLLPVELLDNWFAADAESPLAGQGGLVWWRFSILRWLDSPTELWLAYLAGMAVLLLFTLGFWTRATSILALLVVLSFTHRGPHLSQIVESLLSMSLLYLAIGPCGTAFSLGAGGSNLSSPSALSITATISQRLLQVHVALIYLLMGLSKVAAGDIWMRGEAVWRIAAKADSRLVDLTSVLQPMPYAYQTWTYAVVLFELVFGILIWQPLARPLLLALATIHWTSMALITGDVPFCALMLILSFAFVPPRSEATAGQPAKAWG